MYVHVYIPFIILSVLINKSAECITLLWFKKDIATKSHNFRIRGGSY